MTDGRAGIEIERKYIIERPSLSELEAQEGYFKSEIVQIYLTSEGNTTRRVRKRTRDGVSRYFETEKVRIDEMSVTETEREIGEAEFDSLSLLRDPNTRPIIKTRHAFFLDGISYEIDVYPEWERTCILENELSDRSVKVDFPPFIRVVREVTGVRGYSNASMSKQFPKEDHL